MAKEEWERAYGQIDHKKLPWYNIQLPKALLEFVKIINKKDLLLITGCGTGDTVFRLWKKGFKNIIGFDISNNAIKIAQKDYPQIKFYAYKTQDIAQKLGLKNANVADLNVLHHQKHGVEVKKYVDQLKKLSKNLCLAYFYEPDIKEIKSGIKEKEAIYIHDPSQVEKLFEPMKKVKEFRYEMDVAPKMFDKKYIHAVGQIYGK